MDEPTYYIGSADMMTRNLDLRVEVLVPVRHPKHRSWLDKVFEILLADDIVRFELNETDRWIRVGPTHFTFENDGQGRLMKWATDLQLSKGQATTYDLDERVDSGEARGPSSGLISRIRGLIER